MVADRPCGPVIRSRGAGRVAAVPAAVRGVDLVVQRGAGVLETTVAANPGGFDVALVTFMDIASGWGLAEKSTVYAGGLQALAAEFAGVVLVGERRHHQVAAPQEPPPGENIPARRPAFTSHSAHHGRNRAAMVSPSGRRQGRLGP